MAQPSPPPRVPRGAAVEGCYGGIDSEGGSDSGSEGSDGSPLSDSGHEQSNSSRGIPGGSQQRIIDHGQNRQCRKSYGAAQQVSRHVEGSGLPVLHG
eukprot:7830833-Heterocapsa_arctica.AAC.1